MKILYIDFVSHLSHVNFNRMHIKALQEYALIDFVFKDGYSKKLGIGSASTVFVIPKDFYKIKGDGFLCRLQYLIILFYIKYHISFKFYDKIIFSYYEEISLFFANYPKGILLINHVNISGLSSKVKLFFYKKISKDNTQIVFNNSMKNYLNSLGVTNVEIIHHGIIDAFKKHQKNDLNILNFNFEHYDKVIFSPSSSSSDSFFLQSLVTSRAFKTFLMENNYLFIVKSKDLKSVHPNIYIINYYISDDLYEHLFVESDIIAICYPKTFKFRVSGVFLECISNKKNVILSNIEALNCYKDIFSSYPYFKDIDSFIECFNIYKKKSSIYKDNIDLSLLMPSYSDILHK